MAAANNDIVKDEISTDESKAAEITRVEEILNPVNGECSNLNPAGKAIPEKMNSESNKTTKEKASKKEEKPDKLYELCTSMFSELESYLEGEVASSVEDYKLLERMNKFTSNKYENMLKVAVSVGQAVNEINHKYADLRPYLDQLEQIEESVLALEQAAYRLDGYAKRLEERFRNLEKR